MSKNSRFRQTFHKQHGEGSKHCWNLNHATTTMFIDHCESNWVGKKTFSDMQSLGMFCNVLTTYDKYSLLNRDNFRQPIQIDLSQKRKTFSQPVSLIVQNLD